MVSRMKKVCQIIFIFGLCLCSCTVNNAIKEIKIAYINQQIETPFAYGCWDIFAIDSVFLNQIRITDPIITESMYKLVTKLHPDTSCTNVNVRITCLLRYNESRPADTLCIGEQWGTILNGVNVCDSKALFELIHSIINIDCSVGKESK
jgi:hypothetical protein